MILTFREENFKILCDKIAHDDKELKCVLQQYGYPPMWTRRATFTTLIHIILEQQVSLASAKAALNKLKEKTGIITPKKLLRLTDADMRACYFSRQKTVYARHLAEAILSKQLDLKKLNSSNEGTIREQLKRIKGIGDWTVDIYLLMALQRSDIFPVGDLAMINSFKKVKQLPHNISKEELLQLAENWRPNRSIAAMILWHHYIMERNIKS